MSTWSTYQSQIEKLHAFCLESDTEFPNISQSTLADYLCCIAAETGRPKSVLNLTLAAVASMVEALKIPSPITADINRLVTGLIKSGTTAPMQRSKVMPVEPFKRLFRKWNVNEILKIESLRLKCVTLLALAMMLRPSDIAPHATLIDKDGKVSQMKITVDQVKFAESGHMVISLHGIKNDYHRDGFDVVVTPSSEAKVDPVDAMKVYIQRTAHIRPAHRALFLSLKRPFDAISATTVTRILEKAIILAGMKSEGYSAKCFRPTGATNAIQAGVNPDVVRKVGRWKSRETFEQHYVHSRPPKDMTDVILKGENSGETIGPDDVQCVPEIYS